MSAYVNQNTNLVLKLKGSSLALDIASCPTKDTTGASHVSTDVTVLGAELGDFVLVSSSIDLVDTQIDASVTAADVVTVIVTNQTAGAVNHGVMDVRILVIDSGFASA